MTEDNYTFEDYFGNDTSGNMNHEEFKSELAKHLNSITDSVHKLEVINEAKKYANTPLPLHFDHRCNGCYSCPYLDEIKEVK